MSHTQQHEGLRRPRLSSILGAAVLALLAVPGVKGWGGSSETDLSLYSDSYTRDWLDDDSSISMMVDGCVMSYVSNAANGGGGEDNNNDNEGCMENSSEDGTTYWYQMANCKRPNVAYSLYAASSGSASCKGGNFKETFVSTGGLAEFINMMNTYDANSPFGGNDDGNGNGFNYDELPSCEQGNNGYIGLGCASDGTFAVLYYNDKYCTSETGKTYDSLSSLNSALSYYKSCRSIYQSSGDNTIVTQLITYSETCSSLDSSYCQESSAMSKRRGSSSVLNRGTSSSKGYYKSWSTKAKYVMGGLLLLAAFIMFTGILFTNRRRRRALLQRKFRQSRSSKSRKSSKSRSKSRDPKRSSSSRRSSKSRTREEAGVLT